MALRNLSVASQKRRLTGFSGYALYKLMIDIDIVRNLRTIKVVYWMNVSESSGPVSRGLSHVTCKGWLSGRYCTAAVVCRWVKY